MYINRLKVFSKYGSQLDEIRGYAVNLNSGTPNRVVVRVGKVGGDDTAEDHVTSGQHLSEFG